MQLVITLQQPNKKQRTIVSALIGATNLATLKKIHEAQVALNEIPGSDIRWNFEIKE